MRYPTSRLVCGLLSRNSAHSVLPASHLADYAEAFSMVAWWQ